MGFWYWNEETQLVFWDQKPCEIFDVDTSGEKTLDTFYDRLHPEDVEHAREVWRYQLEPRLPCDVEYRVVRP
jgi:PAS domain-containing protein